MALGGAAIIVDKIAIVALLLSPDGVATNEFALSFVLRVSFFAGTPCGILKCPVVDWVAGKALVKIVDCKGADAAGYVWRRGLRGDW